MGSKGLRLRYFSAVFLCLFLWQTEVHAQGNPLRRFRYWVNEKLANIHGYDSLEKLKETKQARPSIDKAALRDEIKNRMSRVIEFQAIKEMADKHGIKVYLFGGTAAAWGHYVHWDMLREAGDDSYQKNRFDYQYTSIFRASQDLDLVVDGPVEKLGLLQQEINQKFPYFVGNKNAWELRPLRESLGDKEALLNNPDFLNQHTDSNSTGLIEITGDDARSAIRDLLDFDKGWDGIFFNDIHDSKLHYYYNAAHYRTSRYLSGMNPPIFSVIRYLTKAFQFEIEISKVDWEQLQRVVGAFNPKKDLKNEYTRGWVERNAKKLFQHSTNIEYASDVITMIGLKKKLQAVSDPRVVGTMGWFLNREPLRSKPLGKGIGKTARELGLRFVAHDTRELFVYESITKSKKGEPNVLISTKHLPGDTAGYGWGFYTQVGDVGAWGTGITIKFELNPDAREGADFLLVGGNYVVVRNKNALRVVPDGVSVDFKAYFTEILPERGVNRHKQLAEFDLLNRSVRSKMAVLTDEEFAELEKAILEYLSRKDAKSYGVEELFKFLDANRKIHLYEKLIDAYRARLKQGLNVDTLTKILFEQRYLDPDISKDKTAIEFVDGTLGKGNKYLGIIMPNRDTLWGGAGVAPVWVRIPEMNIKDNPRNVELFDAYNLTTHSIDDDLTTVLASNSDFYAALPDAKSRALTLISKKSRGETGHGGVANAWLVTNAFSKAAWKEHPAFPEIVLALVQNSMRNRERDYGSKESS
ncbi:MAG: hypothetical protein HYW49_12695, partial [Deltaproteobacteria bacterium]|nr:hypothetical protein [Deltaproteobacteria bacterium]